ncbi:hypothetical protein IQ241_01610 [Romeria aff. gracilis LEGE 07310]|uniref:Uncharacterized protein n=1 Tax=Vasconcelosia minhoensis LEGE 07310 TaxID=915328 RepID=A0A8J7AEN0_9CYAN|nr:hypothetical protein [Romeria gracilis]MBE9076003.1 hypothetical protein [Romeria aff. gracilis LEGE 07310]
MKLGFLILFLSAIPTPALALPTLATSPTAVVSSLDLDGEGTATTHIVKVADLSFSTDSALGLTLSVTSGSLTKPDGVDIDFQVVTVLDNDVAPSEGDFSVPSGSVYTYTTSGAGNHSRDLYILYRPAALQDPGNYASTIDVWVDDNN